MTRSKTDIKKLLRLHQHQNGVDPYRPGSGPKDGASRGVPLLPPPKK